MPGLKTYSQNKEMINSILDTAWSPVAKFRLLSSGVSPNNLLDGGEKIVGQKECIACGNCVDACPVVLRERGRVDLQTQRTSLHLEEIVDDACIRCYRCIQSCPQVDPKLKIVAVRHRMTEKVVHWWMVLGYLLLASTGIMLNHFREMWADPFIFLVSVLHKCGAVMFLASPFLFYYFDRYHFKRTMKAVFSFTRKDKEWWAQAFRSVFKGEKRPFQGEFNSGQKYWYLVVLSTMTVLGITGIIRWFGEGSMDSGVMNVLIWIHIIFALIIDLNFIYHFGRKFLSRLIQWFKAKSKEAVNEIEMVDTKTGVAQKATSISIANSQSPKISA